ncbi:hypothetical protein [Xanthomonas sp. D-109]|uniref:hypothetical protein n=1 Tax=Xanthomonas sp. D-109 TaxID=2821274 RepID=UPI001ADCC71C|nr:hypothetical protein [Xanthomonas sp. D-109]MBO9881230.1 hypothetical protein [Xanthomonas sp. D-109]
MRLVLVTALFLAAFSAEASSTMCAFYAPPGTPVPNLEFLGYDKIGGILIQDKNGPRSLPQGSYKVVALDQSASRIDLTYTNPGDPSLPPSFRLRGAGPDTTLTVRGKTYKGKLSCGAW